MSQARPVDIDHLPFIVHDFEEGLHTAERPMDANAEDLGSRRAECGASERLVKRSKELMSHEHGLRPDRLHERDRRDHIGEVLPLPPVQDARGFLVVGR
ncbi:hypothetical protein [Paramicrobacterium fandaimingii]|uniref:hypothetical protein n=1 Tax=Paramicrobacterium fandaimingii TaxID=2708079 RepID=UPI001422EF4B|nr:hypothetical protein [Microbacterium fandaimingii]